MTSPVRQLTARRSLVRKVQSFKGVLSNFAGSSDKLGVGVHARAATTARAPLSSLRVQWHWWPLYLLP